MHAAPRSFVARVLEVVIARGPLRVLEVGSYDVNGSIRGVFRDSPIGAYIEKYVGADLMQGPGVDVVKSGHDLDFEDEHFDITASFECFEHNPYWKETLENMVRMLRPGGLCIVSCASLGRPEHGTARIASRSSPGTHQVGWNYYRNISLGDFRAALDLAAAFPDHVLAYGAAWNDLYFVGRKRGNGSSLATSSQFLQHWQRAAICQERASLKRRLTHVMERVLGRTAFQYVYVNLWRVLKPRPED